MGLWKAIYAFDKEKCPAEPHIINLCFKGFQRGEFPMKTVTITTKDGKSYSESMDCHPGHPRNMMSDGEFCDRFRIAAALKTFGSRKLVISTPYSDSVNQAEKRFWKPAASRFWTFEAWATLIQTACPAPQWRICTDSQKSSSARRLTQYL